MRHINRKDGWVNEEINTAVLLVSRQVSEEALDALYGENVFEIVLHARSDILIEIAPANRQRIRRLQLAVRPFGIFYGLPLDPDSQIWPRILANLTKLSIVAQQPRKSQFPDTSLEQEVNKWLTWLKPILEYVNQSVSSGIVVEVDHNDCKETSELIKECLPNRCRKVQNRTGDVYFERGEFRFVSRRTIADLADFFSL